MGQSAPDVMLLEAIANGDLHNAAKGQFTGLHLLQQLEGVAQNESAL